MNEYLARLKAKIQEKPIPQELSKLPKAPFDSFGSDRGRRVFGFDKRPEPDEAWIEERKALAAGGAPGPYLDAWARLQVQKPMRVPDAEWRQAIDDAGRFLDQWGSMAAEFQWTAGELFEVPRDGKPGGLVWFQKGECVRSLGPGHAVLGNGERVFEKLANSGLATPILPARRYRPGQPSLQISHLSV